MDQRKRFLHLNEITRNFLLKSLDIILFFKILAKSFRLMDYCYDLIELLNFFMFNQVP